MEIAMQWSEVVDNPYFENLPFKIKLNRYGKIEMTPALNKHGRLQFHLGSILERKLKKGEVFVPNVFGMDEPTVVQLFPDLTINWLFMAGA
jgi:hypothetical protein